MSELLNPFNYWIPLGILAFLFAIINLLRALNGKKKGWTVLLFLSLSCGVLVMLTEYLMINRWVQKGDWSALMDVVPTMSIVFSILVIAGIILNGIVLIKNARK